MVFQTLLLMWLPFLGRGGDSQEAQKLSFTLKCGCLLRYLSNEWRYYYHKESEHHQQQSYIIWFFLWCKNGHQRDRAKCLSKRCPFFEFTMMSSLWSLHWQFTVFSNLNQTHKWHVLVLVSMKDEVSMFV